MLRIIVRVTLIPFINSLNFISTKGVKRLESLELI